MKFAILLTALFLTFGKTKAQKKEFLQFKLLSNKNGTGDNKGITTGFQYYKFRKKKSIIGISFLTTINDGEFNNIYEYPTGTIRNGSLRYTIAGLQLTTQLGWSIFTTKHFNAIVSGGVLLRYQNSSYWETAALLYPALTNIPYPVFVIDNFSKQKTISVGFSPDIQFNYKLNDNYLIGLNSSFQFDTQGDNIINFGLTISKKLH